MTRCRTAWTSISRLAAVMERRLTATVEPSVRRRFRRPPFRSAERICCQKHHCMARRARRKGRISTPTGVTMTAACFRQRLPAIRQRTEGTSAAACMAHRGAGRYGVIVS
ncbi:hypothetical protein CXU19_09715 [Akkermansia muciniphila]|nr:hypothetical protein CXU19_09715 [Akkermansia muciniphila]